MLNKFEHVGGGGGAMGPIQKGLGLGPCTEREAGAGAFYSSPYPLDRQT